MWEFGGNSGAAFLFIVANLSAFLFPGVASGTESRFTELPESLVIPEGLRAVFRCRASTVDSISYYWTHNGLPVENATWLTENDGILSIKAVNHVRDSGDYVCIVQNLLTGAREATPPATLDIVWIHSAAVQLASPAIQEGDDVTLKCIIVGSGAEHVRIEWFRNGVKLTKEPQKYDFTRRKLHIRRVTKEDNGIYRCAGHNEAGSVFSRRNFILRIPAKRSRVPCHGQNLVVIRNLQKGDEEVNLCREKRKNRDLDLNVGETMKQEQASVVIDEGKPIRLACAFTDHGIPLSIRWRKDGKPFRSLDINTVDELPMGDSTELSGDVSIVREDPRVTVSKDNGSLMFVESVATDEGNYDCQVVAISTNELKFVSPLFDVQVIEQLKFMPRPTSKNLELGAMGKLHCKAQGTPSPQVKWHREGPLAIDDSVDDINGTLIFRNVTADHRGNYSCTAKNRQGEIHATVTINVVMSPRFLVAPEGPVQASEMGIAMFHCQAIGDPKPTVQWDKDLEYLNVNASEDGRFRLLDNGTLFIAEVHPEDEGKYGCTIGNSAGLKREEVRLVVKSGATGEETSDGFTITRAVLITMSFAAAYIILVVALMLWCRYKRQARKNRMNVAGKENGTAGTGDGGVDAEGRNGEVEPCLKPKGTKKANGVAIGGEHRSDDASSGHSKGSKKSGDEFDKITLARSSLFDIIPIGRGEFGDVFVGKIKEGAIRVMENGKVDAKVTTESEKRRSKTSIEEFNEIKVDEEKKNDTTYKLVLIKALNKVKDEAVCAEFKRQIDLFRSVSYRSVSALFGLCRDKDPHYLVLEYTDWGDLKQFLLATSGKTSGADDDKKSPPPPLNVPQILTLAHQIARGMDAIYRAKFIHRDLATRNCVISSDFRAKISYPALSRDKYSREYFKYRNQVIPLRWLAPECLQDDDYSTKSDVWAYGVVVWELFTRATEIPFESLSNEEVFAQAQAGKLEWSISEATPECLRPILMTCWTTSAKERPSFSQLTVALVNALKNECPTKDSQ
ncbi:tyrosine-protein kinase-like otk isoform X2 [Phlebotomus papatasi]|uniref:tyrosine-protein kinase-like otk isoform X2 n=1 Tax=Phlebotomus papatasi TaxID=29031 RepID=UPI0024839D32|nr:tyrosine-protein kinase-like otk isoform X2 [Phlebotomus papatasi]